jgi:hypothetical protein
MKVLLTIPMLATIVTTGIVSCHLFQKAHYGASDMLTIASFLSIILWINLLSNNNLLSDKKSIAC